MRPIDAAASLPFAETICHYILRHFVLPMRGFVADDGEDRL